MLGIRAKNRWQAFGIHLLISLILFIAMCTIIVVFWYPGILFTTEGGWQGVRLIAGIDFVIGPVLTLIVYQVGKKSLKFDLTCIGILQAVCITYGMYVVHYSRPAVVAYADGFFYTAPLLRFESRGIDVSGNALLKEKMPAWVNIRLPEDKLSRIQLKLLYTNQGLETAIALYEPYDRALPLLKAEGFSLEEAAKAGITIPPGLDTTTTRVFKLITRYDAYAVAVNVSDGRFLDILSVIKGYEAGLVPKTSTHTQQ